MRDSETLDQYVREIQQFVPTTNENTRTHTWSALVVENLRLVLPLAYQYARRSRIDLLDLVQVGNIGLMRAAKTYDPSRAKFSTHATWWIKQAIREAIEQGSSVLTASTEKMQMAFRLQRELHKDPDLSLKDLAQRMNISEENARALFTLTQEVVSLNQTTHENDDESLADTLEADADACNPERVLLGTSSSGLIEEMLAILMPDEQQVIVWRYGLDKKEACTQEEVARRLRIRRERVGLLEARALLKMRRHARVYLLQERSA